MRCKTYQKLLHLNRRGELLERQRRKLNRHIKMCTTCAETKRKLEKTDSILNFLRNAQPRLSEPQHLTNDILNHVRIVTASGQNSWIETATEKILDWFSIPKVRLALIGITVFCIGIFFVQESILLYRISNLEKKVALKSKEWIVPDKVISNRAQIPSSLQNLDELDSSVNIASLQEEINDEWVLIKRNTLTSLLGSNEKLLLTNKILLKWLEQFSLEVEGISLEDGIDRKELELLLKRKKQIIEIFREL